MGNGNGGLKKEMGVDDPAQAGSDKQSQEFQASFQKEITAISGHLTYTATNAKAARHDPLAARRDALYPSFQSALGQIDRTNPAKAQGAIGKVLGDASALNGEVTKFRQEAEKARNDWKAREPKLETAVQQVEELEKWEDAKAPPLRGLVDGIRTQVNERKFGQACKIFDQLEPKLKPIYDEYLKQKAAKEKYDPALAALQPRLNDAAVSHYAKLKPMQDEIIATQKLMESSAQTKDFVKALEIVGDLTIKVDTYAKALEELEQQKKAYEDALAALQPRLTDACNSQPAKLAPQRDDMATVREQMEAAAQGEDYVLALQQVTNLSTLVDAYEAALQELAKQKKAYEDALAVLQPRLTDACNSQSVKLAPQREDMATVQRQMETAAQSEDYEQALQQLNTLSPLVDEYEAAVKRLEEQKKAYEDALAALQPRLTEAGNSQSVKLAPLRDDMATVHGEMETAAQGEDYEQALAKVNSLSTMVDAYETAVQELEKKKKAFEDALAALQPRLTECVNSQSTKLAPQREDIEIVYRQIESAALGEEFDQALEQVNNLSTLIDTYEAAVQELEKQKLAHEEAFHALEPQLAEVCESRSPSMAPMRDDIAKIKGEIETAVQNEDYEQALKGDSDLKVKIELYLADLKQAREAYEVVLSRVESEMTVASACGFTELAARKAEVNDAYQKMLKLAEGEDFKAAEEAGTALEATIKTFVDDTNKLRDTTQAKIKEKLASIESEMNALEEDKSALYGKINGLIASVKAGASSSDDAALEKAGKDLEELSKMVDELKNDPCLKARRSPKFRQAERDYEVCCDDLRIADIGVKEAKAREPWAGIKLPELDPGEKAASGIVVEKAEAQRNAAQTKWGHAIDRYNEVLKEFGCTNGLLKKIWYVE